MTQLEIAKNSCDFGPLYMFPFTYSEYETSFLYLDFYVTKKSATLWTFLWFVEIKAIKELTRAKFSK